MFIPHIKPEASHSEKIEIEIAWPLCTTNQGQPPYPEFEFDDGELEDDIDYDDEFDESDDEDDDDLLYESDLEKRFNPLK